MLVLNLGNKKAVNLSLRLHTTAFLLMLKRLVLLNRFTELTQTQLMNDRAELGATAINLMNTMSFFFSQVDGELLKKCRYYMKALWKSLIHVSPSASYLRWNVWIRRLIFYFRLSRLFLPFYKGFWLAVTHGPPELSSSWILLIKAGELWHPCLLENRVNPSKH